MVRRDPQGASAAHVSAAEAVDFGGLRISFDHRVLRPRSWTAAQSHWASDLLRTAPAGHVLELCTGAGQLGLLAVAGTDRRLVAVDVSPAAVSLARANAEAAGLAEQVEIRQGNLDETLDPDEQFAVIIADPPWVSRADVARYPEDPVLAIDGGTHGLDLALRCLDVIEHHLADGGSAVLQLGTLAQVARVQASVSAATHLRVVEHREFPDHGVLVRIDRSSG